ncbi:MAG: GNAT family N-acetyltransferase [Janthinobacterium lividum]
MTAQSRVADGPGRERPGGFGELRAGHLGVRIATSAAEIDAVQSLRYRVFYEEMGAEPGEEARASRRDADAYDEVADHLLVVDHAIGPGPEGVVGTYRLIRQHAAAQLGRFYSEDEYDISQILRFGQSLELGRSCVTTTYRTGAVMQLLWRGIAAYVSLHHIEVMFGCASLPGTDPERLATELSYLYYNHLAPPALRPVALPGRRIDMRRMAPELIEAGKPPALLPPLIKGYLRLGGFVGDGAVIDRQFNTTDVAVVVKTDLVTDRYYRHYQLRDAHD